MKSISKVRARKVANRILRQNKKGRSWRAIASEDYPTVKPGTLCRFAKGKGDYIPTDDEILIALGLKKPRREGPRLPKWLNAEAAEWFAHQRQAVKDMAKETREEVARTRRGEQ